jgi:coenzyme F420-reducing hydrogenase beta subunit
MNIRLEYKKECCGCTACESICNHGALSMQSDFLGFLYPVIDVTKCVECGLCEKVCQFHADYERYDNYDLPIVYSVRLRNKEQLLKSQSGGAFWGLAQYFTQNGGVVYGAAFEETWRVTHQRVCNKEELEKLRMSKYVQSDMRGVYKLIKEELKQGNKVMFSGTACQVAGLKAYLPQKLHEKLFCVDIICHGVPSPKIWEDYIEYLQQKFKSAIKKACFRDKRFGWHGAKESYLFSSWIYFECFGISVIENRRIGYYVGEFYIHITNTSESFFYSFLFYS